MGASPAVPGWPSPRTREAGFGLSSPAEVVCGGPERPHLGQRAGERWHGAPCTSHLTQYPNSLRSRRPGRAALHPGPATWAATGGACPAGEEGPAWAAGQGLPGGGARSPSGRPSLLLAKRRPRHSSAPGLPGGLTEMPTHHPEERFQRQVPPAEPQLTLVSHHWVMHSQQKRWPQGVAVVCLRSSRHRVHRGLLETALSSTWLLWGEGG